mgnify:CR=1 FL=1
MQACNLPAVWCTANTNTEQKTATWKKAQKHSSQLVMFVTPVASADDDDDDDEVCLVFSY